ncbi:MAG: cystathionine gamma-synthase [Candidatus Aminicenantes bacterium]|nr:cystathionine gamma-synthase [Candidatus Aminicenantes bacterium]NIM78021.1 cystathionine gamma-synthase [Candidatus Aminicenantes bacterium]NIN17341.1 cystathionine gamma-synthase [Candidatus Aminicenantes bacterium]NIN41234.1 cystathionine gamma-synthase [Candidatus Aminicenantes bacterium]NIN84007.1 cystathionine gamma-synthase [Candidatus Aminicenantes bacterium]
MKLETRFVHGGQAPEPVTGAITTPIFQTATYVLEKVGMDKGFDYSRTNTPTRRVLEKLLAEIEGAKDATVFGSGLAAIDALLHNLEPGDHILACDDLYGGTNRLFLQVFKKYGLEFDLIDMSKEENIVSHIKNHTVMIFVETPTNPMLKLVDIKMVADIIGDRNIELVVDNTFMTPHFQKPMELGANTVIQSLTKFLSGHNDVVGGAIISNNQHIIERMKFFIKSVGATMGPFDSWLTIRGIKTLAIRMDRINENAIKIAQFLENHPKVSRVIFPGLPSHPQHELAKKQMSGFGGMIGFELKVGKEAAVKCIEKLKLWLFAESLGGVESLITHPVSMTHADVSPEVRQQLGITDGLLRLSVGIEHVDDLIEDLAQAFE